MRRIAISRPAIDATGSLILRITPATMRSRAPSFRALEWIISVRVFALVGTLAVEPKYSLHAAGDPVLVVSARCTERAMAVVARRPRGTDRRIVLDARERLSFRSRCAPFRGLPRRAVRVQADPAKPRLPASIAA